MSDRAVLDIVSDADYLSSIVRVWLAAPAHSAEERLLDEVVDKACSRLGVDRDELAERMVAVAPVARESEVQRELPW